MAFNANQFRSYFDYKKEPARAAYFQVELLRSPQKLIPLVPQKTTTDRINKISKSINSIQGMKYTCSSAELPGKVIGSTDMSYEGVVRKVAYGGMYNTAELNFILSDDMNEKILFDSWHDIIINNNESSKVTYYDDYIGELQITQFDSCGRETYVCTLHEAYPTSIGQLRLGWSDSSTIHELAVTFTYTHWTAFKFTN